LCWSLWPEETKRRVKMMILKSVVCLGISFNNCRHIFICSPLLQSVLVISYGWYPRTKSNL
jgi:hypothetical protein